MTTEAPSIKPVQVVNLRGTQSQMGAQFGEIMRGLGLDNQLLDYYGHLAQRLIQVSLPAFVRTRMGDWTLDRFMRFFLHHMMKQRPEEYAQRSCAFLRVINRKPEEATGYFGMDLFQNMVGWLDHFMHFTSAGSSVTAVLPACSSLMVWGDASCDGQMRHARNFDFVGIGLWDRSPTVVFCDPVDGLRYGFVTTRGADVPGVTAFNEAGLVLTTHTRFHRDVALSGMGIVDLGHEIIRRAATIDQAIAIACERRILSTWGVALSSASEGRGIVLETTGNRVVVVQDESQLHHLPCTNRYRSALMRQREVTLAPCWPVHSDSREERMRQVVGAQREKGGMASADLMALLGDHCLPVEPQRPRSCGDIISSAITVQSIVTEAAAGRIFVSVGGCPTGWGPYIPVEWKWGEPGTYELQSDSCSDCSDGQPRRPGLASKSECEAYTHYLEACRRYFNDEGFEAVAHELKAAVDIATTDPAYLFLNGLVALRESNAQVALEHFSKGLSHENTLFRRGSLLLWGARAADISSNPSLAKAMRSEVLGMNVPSLALTRIQAHKDEARSQHPRSYKHLVINPIMVDGQ